VRSYAELRESVKRSALQSGRFGSTLTMGGTLLRPPEKERCNGTDKRAPR